ncbi:MAG: FAD-dependent oxidoreductase, partial [Zoogloeaceae bacterium]|nr:FAD-dependent oxidoreductase [Zoogloeaceae bacterium]
MQERAANNHCDVLVIGGGPAGTTAATLLARQGWQVTILEKDHHPRFHIGESLLPANLDLLRRLGVAEQTAAIGLEKHAAEFVSPAHGGRMQRFEFCNAWEKTMPFAWQVKRAEFDKVLIDNAVKNKVRVIEGCKVGKVAFADDHATIAATHDDGTAAFWTARFVLDASGRDAFLANRMQSKFRNPRHNSSSLYAHFRGAERYPGQAEGNTTIYWFAHGWFWFIPLSGGLTSVGAVVWPHYLKTRGSRDKKQFLLDTIAQCPPLAERLKAAEIATDVEATGNFSYASSRSHGARYLLVGDAYAFIDPVFS